MMTPEQVTSFEENGYLVVPDALSPDELAAVRRAAAAAEARWRADPSLPGVRRPDLEQVLGIMEHGPEFADLLEHPRLFPLVRRLLGPDVMMLDHDYFMTPPGAEIPFGWHFDFDMPAVDHPRSLLMVKVFYVLEDIPEDGGATLVLPGSHRTPRGAEMPNCEVPEDLPGAVKMALPAGTAYLITGRTYHSAGNNRSHHYRHLLIYTYGHKWMRMWDEYRPSAELAAWAKTPMRRQLLGLTDPYALTPGPSPAPSLPTLSVFSCCSRSSAGEGGREGSGEEGRGGEGPGGAATGPIHETLGIGDWRERFADHGYLMIDDALSPAELAAVRTAADEAEERWRSDPSLPGTRIPEFLEIEAIMEYHTVLFDLVEHPRLFPLIREVLGPDISVVDHAYYITPPGGALDGEAWHTDVRTRVPGVNHARSTMMVRLMIALSDISEDGGATLLLPGTHRQPDDTPIPRVASPEEMPGAVKLACPAGSAYFFHGNVVHSPGTNRGGATRRVLLYNYGHKWMRIWKGHEPSPRLAAQAATPMRRQLLGLTPPYRGPEAELSTEGGPQAGP
ncbi:MAG TPA: phytanoyl-CoA dioxygenase family protein [Thermoanaerobaculia bacterium]|jgi:ectoine hydroxylase-related dioxygenase (phytanoyl-CoA dioxygenase family)|nr:phytanoyl-CoA dioxygenase family protein [Thermoanaerobaculia bacterium]